MPYYYRIKFPLSYCIELFRGLIQYLGGAMYMPVSAACQSCSFLGGQQQLLLHIPVLSFYQKVFMLVLWLPFNYPRHTNDNRVTVSIKFVICFTSISYKLTLSSFVPIILTTKQETFYGRLKKTGFVGEAFDWIWLI